MNRETIMSALFARVSTAGSFALASRRLKLWNSVAPADKPSLFMVERGDFYTRASEAVPETVTLHVDLYIYTDAGQDQSAVPVSTLNGLIDAIETALKPDALTGR
jgi:hypothetical protein